MASNLFYQNQPKIFEKKNKQKWCNARAKS